MTDLIVGIIIMGLLSGLLLIFTLRLSKNMSRRLSNLLAILTVALMLANSLFVTDSVALTHILPFSNLIVVGNWAPLLVAILAGLVWWKIPGPDLRRAMTLGTLGVACLAAVYRPILSAPPKMQDQWDSGVCLQTSNASCSAAACATLLAQYEIKTNEQEMATLCLTSDRGTSLHGIWRGLRLKTAGHGLDVYMFDNATIDQLREMTPALISVELERDADADPRYAHQWGWIPGVAHTVVVLEFLPGDRLRVADPATGRETWTINNLEVLWHGVGARLVKADR